MEVELLNGMGHQMLGSHELAKAGSEQREHGEQRKPTIREVLDHLRRVQMQGDVRANGLGLIPQVIELLRANKTEPPQR